MKLGDIVPFVSKAMQKPSIEALKAAIENLQILVCISLQKELTLLVLTELKCSVIVVNLRKTYRNIITWKFIYASECDLSVFINLLCVSCPSATEFLAILFLHFAWSSLNSLRSFERFRRTLVPNFIQIQLQVKNFLIRPPL